MTTTQDGPGTAPAERATPAQIAQIKQRAAILSVMATILLTAAKIVGAIISGSLALLTDALQGLVDVGSTLFTWFAVRASDKPADDEHHYGHGKVEALADALKTCRTLVWNGPFGAFETPPFDDATVALAKTAAALTEGGSLVSVAGSGDTVAALNHAGVAGDFTFVSTAGGAFLEWMEGRILPGVAALKG